MDYLLPQVGELVTMPDGRQFRLEEVDPPESVRGWWWRARAVDGLSTMQGSLTLQRIGLAGGWDNV